MAPEHDDPTDRLAQSASRGDASALHALLTRFLPEIRAFVRLNMGPHLRAREEPEDIEQSVCREVLADLSSFTDRGEVAFRRWLYMSVLRKIRDRARYHGRERRTAAREQALPMGDEEVSGYASLITPSHVAAQREHVARLRVAFEHLNKDQRAVITMSKMVGMSHADIGAEMGRSANSVAVLLHRSLARLGVMLVED